MTIKSLTRSFAGGVITPEMHSRLDQVKHQTGLAEAENFQTLPHGPAENRAGFGYVLEVKDSNAMTCLIPFIYSGEQSMVLEFGNLYVRFHTAGGTLLNATQAITGITNAAVGVVSYTGTDPANGTWVFLAANVGMTEVNNRWFKVANVNAGANTYELSDLAGNLVDTTGYGVWSAGGTFAPVYEIVSPYATADLFNLTFTQSNDVMTITEPNYQQRELRRIAATNWVFSALAFAPTIATPGTPTVTGSASGVAATYFYVVTAVAEGTLEESYASAQDSEVNDLTVAGAWNDIVPPAVSGAVRFNIYKFMSGLYGFIGQTPAGGTFRDNNITADTTRTPPIADNVMASSGNWPGAVGYYQQRRLFAGTTNDRQRVFATRSGTESNMSYSIPTRDSDRLSFRPAARQSNTIRHIVPLEDLILLTSGGPIVVFSSTGVLTPATIDPRMKGNIGASRVPPSVTGQTVLYKTARGNRTREFAFRGDVNGGYNGVDISIMAPHYFDRFTTTQMAFTQAPHPTHWEVRSDGTLLGMTYVPEQSVAAWHSHTTQGYFESICSVPEGSEDVLYAVIRRELNGRTVRCIERKHTRQFATLADAFFLDCAVFYDGAPATVFRGLDHLNGETVNVLADGAVIRNIDIGPLSDGTIGFELENAASKVCIGLQITGRMKTLPLALEAQAGGQGTTKNVNEVHLKVHESSSIFAGPTYDTVKQVKQRTTEPYGSPPALVSDEKGVKIPGDWNRHGQVCVQQTDPLPITVLSMVLDVAQGG